MSISGKKRLFVLGLDGLACSLIREFVKKGVMPRFAELISRQPLHEMKSVLPTVSSVAWSCFATARNPGKFGVYGFAEVDQRLSLQLPDSKSLKCRTIWEELDAAGKRVIAVSVPLTHPPRRLVRGTLVSCFLADSLEPGTVTPPSELNFFQSVDYRIDVDPTVAWADRRQFYEDLRSVLAGRRRLMKATLARDDWDLFLMHVMDTDRICHFLLKDYRENQPPFAELFENFYREVDALVGEAVDQLPVDAALMILSDHGFCPVKKEVQLNRLLMERGWLRMEPGSDALGFDGIQDDSLAFALVPGRIHLLEKGRYRKGGLTTDRRQGLLDELTAFLMDLRDPETGEQVVQGVHRREDVYTGPHVEAAPELLVDPRNGYDFKAMLSQGPAFTNSPVTGMHTLHDAHLWCSEPIEIAPGGGSIIDAPKLVFDFLEVPLPADADARAFAWK